MAQPTGPDDRSGSLAFRVEVYLPFHRAHPVAGSLAASATSIELTAGGERFEIATGSTTFALGGHNDERVILEGVIAAGSPRAGERVYLQCPDQALLAHLAALGIPGLSPEAARLSRRARALSRRVRTVLIAVAAAVIVGALLLALFLDAAVKRAVAGIPAAWESTLGASLFTTLTAGRPRAPEKDAAVVAAAFARLRPHVAADGCAFEFAVLEDPEVNAFALPGCRIVVFSGLLAQAARPEEIAGVLAHEIQHAVLRHSLQRLVRAAGLQAVVALFLGDLEGLGGVVRDTGIRIQELSYGRDQEREADRTAIDLLAGAGIDPAGLPDFFDRLGKSEGGAGSPALALLSTHPASAERSAALRAAIARLGTTRYEPLAAP